MTAKILQHIKSISKKDQVIEEIKGAILLGKLKPGDAIVENKVAQDLGVGTPLVREALIELEHQGFVQKFPYKGTYVTEFSPGETDQIFQFRLELETLAVEWAKLNATKEDIADLRKLVQGMRQAAKEMQIDQFYENDISFHRKIWQLSGNVYLADALERLVVPLFAFFLMRRDQDRQTYLRSAANHARLLDSLSTAKPVELRKMMKELMLA